MDLAEYFEKTEGTGILATANADGEVDVALYARPHVIDEKTVVFIMRERLSHQNLKSNHHGAYMFIEKGPGYKGKRLFLSKVREEQDSELLQKLRRRQYIDDTDESKFLVFFTVDQELPLVTPRK